MAKFAKKLTLIKNRVSFKQLQSLGSSADFVGRLPEVKTGKEARVQANCKIRRKPGDGNSKRCSVATSRSNEGVWLQSDPWKRKSLGCENVALRKHIVIELFS